MTIRLTIRKRNRVETSPPAGLDAAWTEYQVWRGRALLSRHDTREQADAWARENDSSAIRPQSLAREGYEAAWREKQRLR